MIYNKLSYRSFEKDFFNWFDNLKDKTIDDDIIKNIQYKQYILQDYINNDFDGKKYKLTGNLLSSFQEFIKNKAIINEESCNTLQYFLE